MENFAKSILNYFAAYTETRFRFDKRIDYFWTDNEFNCDLLIFPAFQRNLLEHIQKGASIDLTIHKGEHTIELDESNFKGELIKNLHNTYSLEYLKKCIKQEIENYHKKHGNNIILIADKKGQNNSQKLYQKQSNVQTNYPINQALKEQQKKLFLEGIRKFNNAYSDGVIRLLTTLQEDKLNKLKINLNSTNVPKSNFNPQLIRQQIFKGLQKIANSSEDISEEKYFENIQIFIKAEQFNLVLFDLYFLLRQYKKYLSFGNTYLFFHEISGKDNIPESPSPKSKNNYKKDEEKISTRYPIFLIEINIKEKDDEVTIQSVRDIVIINTPAINSLNFQNIITTPRAARFSDAFTYLSQVEKHIQDLYNFYEPFILTQSYPTILSEKYPEINFRLGLQIVQKENRKLLDYSELITHIDAGKGGKFIGMIRDYVSGNVTNTTDDVDRDYKGRYPRKSVHNIISAIPLTLNASQKRILTAIENSKNKIVVVDGPPGTGKSYTICAITYWANQKNKSVVITSHKKAALDVIDQMMTDQFKKLHPKTKPSIIRLSQDQSSINRYSSTLATQYISSATQRSNNYQDEAEAVKKDRDNYFKEIEKQNDLFWNSSGEYQKYIENLYNLERIKEDLISKGIIQNDDSLRRIPQDEELDLEAIKKFGEQINTSNIEQISLSVIKEIYQQKNRIKDWLAACQNISDYSIKEELLDKIIEFNIEDLTSFQNKFQEISKNLKPVSPIFTGPQKLLFKSIIKQLRLKNNQEFKQKIKDLQTNLEHESIIGNTLVLSAKNKDELLVSDIDRSVKSLFQIYQFQQNKNTITPLLELLNKSIDEIEISKVFDLLRKLQRLFEDTNIVSPNTFQSLSALEKYFSDLLKNIGIDFENIETLNRLFSETDDLLKQIREYISYFVELSKIDINKLPDKETIAEYNHSLYKELFAKNDERTKNLNNFTSSIERIKTSLEYNKRLTLDESKILLGNISCIIAEPDMISQYFPMQEDLIDLLIIDEASQVSIAESISLMLRAKQVIVLGDEYQYGAVAAVNVNSSYSKQYFNDILTSYGQDYNVQLTEQEKEALSEEASREEDPEEQETQPVYLPEEGKKEWLKTFSIRTSTLNFAKALKNYGTSLNVHFRSFPEIIEYSNEFFYRPNQIPLTVNRIRTKPIKQVLRFIPVKTKGISGRNINLDEIEAIKDDLGELIQNRFKGTIGIITTFREQRDRMEEVLRKELKNYHNLEKEHRLTIWFVGDVQGEERDIIYYSLVQSKDDGLSDLRTIFPVIGGTADKTTSLKMQRLNVGFSRPKDTLVIVHSMPLKEYSNTRLGDALKLYHNLREKAVDNYVEDESIFESPAERNLYNLLVQTKFYRENSDKLKLIAQFPIGEYLSNEYKRYVPKYRVDFLLIFSEDGKEKSLILEYDGVEFHTKNPDIVTKQNFPQQYLEYDLERQLELESYGYHFLRINKFSLIPESENDTEIDVLNSLITKKFESGR